MYAIFRFFMGMKKQLVLLFFTLAFNFTYGQDENSFVGQHSVGMELQAYPTGLIPGLRYEHFLNDKWAIGGRFGLQFIDHRNLGKHDDEVGNGFGGSLEVRKYLSSTHKGFSLGFRADYWRNTIDWSDFDPDESGTTKLSILQPTIIAEYTYRSMERWRLIPSLGFGWEWNVITKGEPTGEGPILLLGVSVLYSY